MKFVNMPDQLKSQKLQDAQKHFELVVYSNINTMISVQLLRRA